MKLIPSGRLAEIARLAILTEAVLFLTLCGASSAQESSVVRPSETATARKFHAASTSSPDRPELQHRDARYRLCASDVIALTFPLTPEFNQTVNIQPDGFASLMGAGDVRLEGLTTEESVQAIGTAYSKVLRNPMVTVELKDFNKPYFVVGGQVHQPGKYDLRGYTTASQAIAIAGGFNEAAKHSQVLLFRRVNNDWFEVKNLNLKRILRGQEIGEDPEIRTGDMLFVPQNAISKIKKFLPNSGVGTYYELYH